MTARRNLLRIGAGITLLVALSVPANAQRGTADFTRYVALGDSYGAGYTNDSLVVSHQQFSYPAVIARQAGAVDFQQPLISEPGISPRVGSDEPLLRHGSGGSLRRTGVRSI